MRIAGQAIDYDIASMPYTAGRYAGAVGKNNPELVKRIANAIIPGLEKAYPGEEGFTAQRQS
jgi:hypothetical protein